MDTIHVHGGQPLQGRIRTSGSKNVIGAVMAASTLCEGVVTLHNVPRIRDTQTMIELLNALGAPTRWLNDSSLSIDSTNILWTEAPFDLVRKMRASFHVLGPLLTRFGHARVPAPGGCNIGARPVNYHIDGLKRLGAVIGLEHGVYTAEAPTGGLRGGNIYFDSQSPGATVHLLAAAALARGTTVMENCATEPEVVDAANFLNAMGARIEGAGSTTISVEGVDRLHGGDYHIIPDRMEAGTFALATAITGGDVLLVNCVMEHVRPVMTKLTETGVEVDEGKHGVRIRCADRPKAVNIKTSPYPGFPTDMQQPFGALLTLAHGTSIITETVYESRFAYTNELIRMGANVKLEGRTAIIQGVERLTGTTVAASDLRAGAALLCAALAADGRTELTNVEHIDRGYADIVAKLRSLGANIERTGD